MMHINLLGNRLEEKTVGIYQTLESKPGRCSKYVMGVVAGLGIMINSATQQFINPNIILDYLAQRSQQSASMMVQNYEKQSLESKGDDEFFSLAKPAGDSGLSLAKKEKIYFSLEGFKPTPVKELYSKKQGDERPAVLDTIDAKIGERVLVINKENQTARIYELNYMLVDEALVSTGMNPGDKEKEGDCKTPEGIFKVVSVEDSSNWTYEGVKAYGHYFLRLDYLLNGVSSIGVHGTGISVEEEQKLGLPASHGCARMNNDVVSWYVQEGYLKPGTQVAITADNKHIPPANYTTWTAPATIADNHVNQANQMNSTDEYNYLEDLLNKKTKPAKKKEHEQAKEPDKELKQ